MSDIPAASVDIPGVSLIGGVDELGANDERADPYEGLPEQPP